MSEKRRPRSSSRRSTKDRVLQARIPEQLDDELRERAEQLGLSVSTVVRNVLLHTFDLVEGVVTDSTQIAKALTGWNGTHSGQGTDPEVIAWQEAVLNKNGVCEQCNDILPVGQRAAIGVPSGPRATLLCLQCLAALSPSIDEPNAEAAPNKASKRSAKRTPAKRKKTTD